MPESKGQDVSRVRYHPSHAAFHGDSGALSLRLRCATLRLNGVGLSTLAGLWVSAFLVAALAGCSTDFAPPSQVTSLRVLAVRATPAELHPGQSAQLDALVVDPRPNHAPITELWLACDPDPLGQGRSPCENTDALGSLFAGTADAGTSAPPGIHFLGMGPSATLSIAADLFSGLAPDDPQRQTGTLAPVLLVTVEVDPASLQSQADLQALFEGIRNHTVPNVIALFRVPVSERVPPNANPVVSGLEVNGRPVPDGGSVSTSPNAALQIAPSIAPDSYERYTETEPGGPVAKTERLLSSYFSTEGSWSDDTLESGPSTLTLPSAPTDGEIWVVVRDTRGGVTWTSAPLRVAP